MLGSSCSPCCGWRCYYTAEQGDPVKPSFPDAGYLCDFESEVTTVRAELFWETPQPQECVPRMGYDIQRSTDYNPSTQTGTWELVAQTFREQAFDVFDDDTGLERMRIEVPLPYGTYFTPAMQEAYFRSHDSNMVKRFWFRVRSWSANKWSDWKLIGGLTDPRVPSFYANIDQAAAESDPPYFKVSTGGEFPVEQCINSNARWDMNIVRSSTNAFPDPAVREAMNKVGGGMTLQQASLAVDGYSDYAETMPRFVVLSMHNVEDVIVIVRPG